MRAVTLPKTFTPADIERLEGAMLAVDQVEAEVTHRFGPGVYIRELSVKAGAYLISHAHKGPHLNSMIKGAVMMFAEDGRQERLDAPACFVAPAGRKFGYVLEDMIWQNIYATTETDVATLERELFEPSPTFKSQPLLTEDHTADLEDFFAAIEQFGFSPDEVRAMSENEKDQVPFPFGEYKVMIAPSQIEGKGLFATGNFGPQEVIAPTLIGGKRTPAGRYTNHSKEPNAIMMHLDGVVYLVATRPICGCKGGMIGEEITVDYRQVLSLGIA